jgi:maltooligosyltrehalose trehalohydrolase
MPREWQLRLGATAFAGGVSFSVWAPRARSVAVELIGGGGGVPMARDEHNVLQAEISTARPGMDYVYVLDGCKRRPDPVSRWQPAGVHGPSRIVDLGGFQWSDSAWRGLPLSDYILYELHVGTFTPEGTFEGVLSRLPYLKDLGITAVEIMPVAEFPGGRNWGYDGVHLYAPQSTYGGPDGLKALVDACHRQSLAVVLDVVYNHLGPEGNYLGEYAPFFTSRYRTPWGPAVNFDGPESDGVRRHFVDNALYWMTEYHVDALRLDAIHGIFDFSATHILTEIAQAVHSEAERSGRPLYLIAESDLNDVRVIKPPEIGGYGLDAQWSDDFHHSLHTLLTGTTRGYFADFGGLRHLEKAIAEGFVYDGRVSKYRRRRHGSPSVDRPGKQFVVYIQNHDQVANGSGGERLAKWVTLEQQKLAATLLLFTPNLPMLFQGQEYGETAPFHYFVSHGDQALVEAVRKGRREEFVAFQWEHEFPDPQAESTFIESKLDWRLCDAPGHRVLLGLYRDLIALRKTSASMGDCRKDLVRVTAHEGESWIAVERGALDGTRAVGIFNLSSQARRVRLAGQKGIRWRLALSTADVVYGGSGRTPAATLSAEEADAFSLEGWGAAIYLGGRP